MAKKTGKELAAAKKEKQHLIFAGASKLLGVDPKKMTPSDIVTHKARALVGTALNIPINTVVILGSQPYVDNHGRKWKLDEWLGKGTWQFEYRWVQYAKNDEEKAIVECRIVKGGKGLCGWAIGECSPKSIKMSTLAGYQNHLAQTRAENRAFEAAFGTRFRSELYEGVAKDRTHVEAEIVQKALEAGDTSAEESVPQISRRTPAPDATYSKALTAIARAESKEQLLSFKESIEKGRGEKLYNVEQKGQLLRLINERIKAQK